MNDKEMIEKIRSTFVGEDYIDLAIQHYHNCRRNSLTVDHSYLVVFEFMDNDIKWFCCPARDDVEKIIEKSDRIGIEVILKLVNKYSMKITKWSDGYEVIIHKPGGEISDSACRLSFDEARKMVEGWKYETDNS